MERVLIYKYRVVAGVAPLNPLISFIIYTHAKGPRSLRQALLIRSVNRDTSAISTP